MTTENRISRPDHLEWMAHTPNLDHLRIDELILPGTHNSGSDKQSPNTSVPMEYAQDVSPLEQLRNGVRVLDLRIRFYDTFPEGSPERFQLFHLTSSGRTVAVDIVQGVMEFCEELERPGDPAREIVILDAHQFERFTDAAYAELQALLRNGIGARVLPYGAVGATLAQIWHYHPRQNVILAYNHSSAGEDFWFGVEQRWPGENLFNTNTLKAFVDEVAHEYKPDHTLQAVQCAKYSLPFHSPTDLSEKVDQWFASVDENSYIQNFFIINTDWTLRSNLIANCRHANEIRGSRKASHPYQPLQPTRRSLSSV